ncbi:MAG: HD domain-containing phosphohydrolase [Planctomycetota bacterium]|jgi:putative nucleotidyltransferase with HDIG domain
MVRPVRILVVDDEVQIAQLLSGVLEAEGYDVEYTTKPENAVERLEEESYDLLLTDLRMPRMGGMELIEKAREIRPDVDTLIMTAFASADTAVGALRSGVSDYLSKPFGVEDVRTAVGKALESRAQRLDEAKEKSALTERVEAQEQDLAQNVADLSFLHDMTRLIAERNTPLRACLGALARHFGCDRVILTEGDRVIDRVGTGGDEAELIRLAREAARAGLSRLGAPGCIAAPAARGAVAAQRKAAFVRSDLRLISIAGRDLAMAVENDRLRAEQRRNYLGIVATLIEAVEAKDRFNRGHSRRVAELAGKFARRLQLPEREIELIETGAKLHDIGKIGVPEEILNKPGRLTNDEFDVIKSHPVIGEQILLPLDFLAEARPIVRHHHERWDGGGYPDGLSNESIPRAAALLSIVDSYDAMTSNRPYRDGLPKERALGILGEGAGSQWDPDLVEKFDFI